MNKKLYANGSKLKSNAGRPKKWVIENVSEKIKKYEQKNQRRIIESSK